MIARLRDISCYALAALVICGADPSSAADCPSSKNPRQAFRVSVGGSTTSDVYRLDTEETHLVQHFSGGAMAEQTYYQGLIQTEQLQDGRRTSFTPKSDLKPLFPLKVGQRHRVAFDTQTAGGQKRVLHAEYKVAGKDQLLIGGCRYDILKVERSHGSQEGALTFVDTDWYAPDIRLIVAREFKRNNGETVIHKYDAITPIEGGAGK